MKKPAEAGFFIYKRQIMRYCRLTVYVPCFSIVMQ